MVDLLNAVILGVVEGLTEFIPVSSTGHLIIAGHLLGFEGAKASTFEVFIQLGAILAVVVLYKERFFRLLDFSKTRGFAGWNGFVLLGLTTLPALIFGFLAHKFIKEHLFNTTTVAIGLGVGGVGILLAERFLPKPEKHGLDSLRPQDALLIGLFQCLALWPGVSRAGATILGAMIIGTERKTAAEYSFLAAVPVMFAATGYDLLKSRSFLQAADIPFFAVGLIVSFIAAWLAVRTFIQLLSRYTLTPFGWYRIAAAAALLVLISG
ncbi:MAG: undecaprenyl-diphosphate phosphatase [Candidatus Manganitrophaceae bacterium]|nr:MAG: undecaprenyl-diphosphate phosphatase [Candidatus Manganitrophaceae bacterium]